MLSHFICVSVQCCPWSMALKLLKLPFLCSVYCDGFKNTLRLKWEEGVSYTVSTQERTPSSSVNVSTREEVYVSVRCADGVKIQNCRKACSSSRLLKTRNTHLSCHRLLTEDALFLQQVWAEAVTHGGFYVFTLCSVTDGILLHDPSQCERELTLQFYTFISIFLQFFFLLCFCQFQKWFERHFMKMCKRWRGVAVVYCIIRLFIPCKLLFWFKGNNKEHLLIL